MAAPAPNNMFILEIFYENNEIRTVAVKVYEIREGYSSAFAVTKRIKDVVGADLVTGKEVGFAGKLADQPTRALNPKAMGGLKMLLRPVLAPEIPSWYAFISTGEVIPPRAHGTALGEYLQALKETDRYIAQAVTDSAAGRRALAIATIGGEQHAVVLSKNATLADRLNFTPTVAMCAATGLAEAVGFAGRLDDVAAVTVTSQGVVMRVSRVADANADNWVRIAACLP